MTFDTVKGYPLFSVKMARNLGHNILVSRRPTAVCKPHAMAPGLSIVELRLDSGSTGYPQVLAHHPKFCIKFTLIDARVCRDEITSPISNRVARYLPDKFARNVVRRRVHRSSIQFQQSAPRRLHRV